MFSIGHNNNIQLVHKECYLLKYEEESHLSFISISAFNVKQLIKTKRKSRETVVCIILG